MIKFDLSLREELSEDFEKNPLICNIDKIRTGDLVLTDEAFDKVLPKFYQHCSAVHWTSYEVAKVIVEWVKPYHEKNFIDIGCGLGKLCFYLGIYTKLKVSGIEQRKQLVDIAKKIANSNNLNINIIHGNILNLEWTNNDIFYFFNPFYEQVFGIDLLQIDKTINFSQENFHRYTLFVYEKLCALPAGKIIITYHGFGKAPPPTWKLIKSKFIRGGFLELWEKVQ